MTSCERPYPDMAPSFSGTLCLKLDSKQRLGEELQPKRSRAER